MESIEREQNDEIGNSIEKENIPINNSDEMEGTLNFKQDEVQSEASSLLPASDLLNSPNNSRQWLNPTILMQDSPASSSSNKISSETSVSQEIQTVSKSNGDNVNSFRFQFATRYDPVVEQNLYPKFYGWFKLDGDFVVQRTGSSRIVCLICHCELLMQRRTQNIIDHVSGQKHSHRASNPVYTVALKDYHDIFHSFEPNLQAHQVYFVPDEEPSFVNCVLCKLYVRKGDIHAHILNDPHKSKVISFKNYPNVKTVFYLLDYQLEVYGIKTETNTDKGQPVAADQGISHRQDRRVQDKGFRRRVINDPRKDGDMAVTHQLVQSVEKPNDPNPINRLPRRFVNHQKFLRNNGHSIVCTVCKTGKNKFPAGDIDFHLIQPSHLDAAKLSSSEYLYFCEICDLKFHDEIAWHKHFEKEPVKHQNMASSRKDKVCEHECLTCKVIIYGDTLSLRRHQNSFIRKIERKKETVLSGDMKKYFSSKNVINENGQKLLDDALNVLANQDDLRKCCQDMENALSTYFLNCRAYPFGSRISGLGSSDSDLDVFIDIGDMYDGVERQDEKNQFEIIRTALDLFKKKKEFHKITSRPTARTPIIKLKHKATGLDCDISFRHGLSVENTKFLRFCFELQPIAEKLILLLKKWSHLNSLNENITTYAFAMMAIFYLQTENHLVSVKILRQLNPQKNVVIDGWETIAYTTPIQKFGEMVQMYEGDIVQLLKGFFKYYADFNYTTSVVCPLMGTIIQKTQFTEDPKGGKLPKEMRNYIEKINTEENPEYFRSLSQLCIQDPFDLSHNLTKACSGTIVEKFRKLCLLSYQMLDKMVD